MAFSAYIQIGDIKGEATDANHKEWIGVMSYQHSLALSAGFGGASHGGGDQAGQVTSSELSFVKALDKSSPLLAQHCCDGKEIPKTVVELSLAGGDQHVYMRYTFEKCIVSSVSPSGSSGGEDRPLESVSLRFRIMQWEYIPYVDGKPKPAVKAGWNFEENASKA